MAQVQAGKDDEEIVGGRVAGRPVSGLGESEMTADGEGDWWQGSKWLLACSAWM